MKKTILILDNYDSFTHNLYHLLYKVRPEYDYEIMRNRDPDLWETDWNGVIVSPGPGTPEDTGLLKRLFKERIVEDRIPYLGICLGMQFLAAYYGIPVKQIEPCHGRKATVHHRGKGIFRNVKNPFEAARYNSLGIDKAPELFARSPLEMLACQENDGPVMALRHKTLPFMGVQYHPESFLTEESEKLMDNFFGDFID